jgi:hypothetical protein
VTQNSGQANTKKTFNAPSWDNLGDLEFSSEAFADFDSSIFMDDSESASEVSSLQISSKKINKSSPVKQASHKRSKRARNPWTPKEDAKLMELMKKYGQSWAMISSMLEGRTGKQVRDRYLNKLRPNIKLGDWSAQEDELLVSLCKEIGNRWSLIASHLPGRTEGQVKNRYYSHIKKRLEGNGSLSQISGSRTESDGYTSFATSPQVEEQASEFDQEFDFSKINGCELNFSSQSPFANANQTSSLKVSKGPYTLAEEALSDKSTAQSPSYKGSDSPLRIDLIDPTDVISYSTDSFAFNQLPRADSFVLPSIQTDCQFDDMLDKVTNYFAQPSNITSDVDAFFSEDLRTEGANLSSFAAMENNAGDRLMQLSKRKAYLEMALSNTLKELNGF